MPNLPEWTDVRYFLEVARTQKITAAAERMGVEHSTVSRRIDRLERDLGAVLFDRRRNGYVLTDAGRSLIPHAEAMESALLGAIDESRATGEVIAGTVRVGTPEAFGIIVLAPRLARLRAEYPNLQVELMAQPQFPSLAAREVEVLITVEHPEAGRYMVTRLTDITYYLYASEGYLASHTPVREIADLADHSFVDYVQDGTLTEQFRLLPELTGQPLRTFRSTSIIAQRQAAAAGLGFVLLTPYVAGLQPDLVKVLPGQAHVTRTLWLAAPQDLFRIRRVRAVWDMLRAIVAAEPQLFS